VVFAVTDAGRSAFDASLVVAGAQGTFARDHLAVIVPLDNPSKVRSLADLARPGLKLEVPTRPCRTIGHEFHEFHEMDDWAGTRHPRGAPKMGATGA